MKFARCFVNNSQFLNNIIEDLRLEIENTNLEQNIKMYEQYSKC